MAEIYKARLEGIGGFQRTFAIKRILPNLSQNSDYIAMLVDEAKVAGLLSHANIVQILDLGQVDRIWYIAMEFVDGRDLGAVLRRANAKGLCLPVPHAVFIAIELLKGLEYAHQRQVMRGGKPIALNIIHRDVSPPNILLSYQGEVKLTDFGIARASLKVMETVSGVVKGRFDYMSPEQAAASKDLDQRSDLFSVGVVLYEILTGRHPFRTDNEIATVERVRTGRYTPISQINPEVPFTLETIVDRALQVDRSERYPSATAFKEALDKFFHDAGFIFTNATLASYVKGLFPGGPDDEVDEATQHDHRAIAEDPATEPDLILSLEAEDSTARHDRRILSSSSTAEALDLDPPEFDDWDDEQETVIRAALPGLGAEDDSERKAFGADDPTAIQSMSGLETSLTLDGPSLDFDVDDEMETVIRSIPDFLADPTDRSPLDEAIGLSPREVTRSGSSTGSRRRRRVGVGWLGWVLAVCMLMVGLLSGAAASAALGWLFVLDGFGATTPSTVLVDAPRGTAIILDGDAVMGEIEVSPGPHRLEIVVRGRAPIVREFTVAPGEERVFLVEQPKSDK